MLGARRVAGDAATENSEMATEKTDTVGSETSLRRVPDSMDDKLALRVWLQLLKCSKAIESLVSGQFRRSYGQSLARFDVLSQLYRFGNAWTAVGELARHIIAPGNNITALLDRMVSEDLIERRASPSDRRSHQVRMTDSGRKLFLDMTRDHSAWVDAAMGDMTEDDKETLIELLMRVRRSFEGATRADGTD